MFPRASIPNATARELAMQTEKTIPVPAGLNFVINAQPLPAEGLPKPVDVSGKLGEVVVPATYSKPLASTAIPATLSPPEPPRYVT